MNKCEYKMAYIGTCGLDAVETYCPDHSTKECIVDSLQANRDCNYDQENVCGYPLCDHCTFTLDQDGKHVHFVDEAA